MPSQNVTPNNNDDDTKALHPWDLAVVYNSLAKETCGHAIAWNRFQNVPQKCPFCQGPVRMICDKQHVGQEKFVLFKYNKQTFMLSLDHAKRRAWWDRRECTAQERMAYSLGMNEMNGLKVLYKGKVLYPNVNRTPTDISSQLVEISEDDVENHHAKASLVVMGTRQGQGLHEPREGLLSILLGMSVTIVYNLFKLGYSTVMYLYSFVKPLPPPEEGRRDE